MSEVAMETVTTSLAVGDAQRRAGVYALGAMDEQEFETNLTLLKRGMERLDRIIRDVLVLGTDYDEPHYAGTYKDASGKDQRKKNLLLPGAEKLAFMARLVASYGVNREVGDGDRIPAVAYTVVCSLHLGDTNGAVAATGLGSANTHERKYRYRMGERACPGCGVVGSIRKSKWADKNEARWWYCMDCRREYGRKDRAIVEQHIGMVVNPDPYDLDNTVLKMAKTRAYRDAVKQATGGSARLTQDMEEPAVAAMVTDEHEDVQTAPVQPKPAPPAKPLPNDGTPLAQPVYADVRKKMMDALFISAKARGIKKMSDLFMDIQRICGLPKPLTHQDDIQLGDIELVLARWDEEADAASDAMHDVLPEGEAE